MNASEHGYAPKLLPGSTDIAAARLSDGRIIAAGGTYAFDNHDVYGDLVKGHSGMEVLDPVSKTWSILPSMMHDETGCGFVLSNGHFAVLSKSFFDSYDVSAGTWERLESSGMQGEVSSVCRVGSHLILAICNKEAKVYDELLGHWLQLPLQKQSILGAEVGLRLENRGEPFFVSLVATKAVSIGF